jgi:GNAT superfamily N-acetyltransferase
MKVRVEPLSGEALARGLPALARLRIAVFRSWPYLYDGTLDHEQTYLSKLAAAPGAVIVAASDGDEIIGCATAAPLAEVEGEFSEPLVAKGYDIASLLYCGESVLLPAYRGRGLGHAFFDQREAHGRKLGGLTHSTFCAVQRPAEHPLRPGDYVPLDAFWAKRGYTKLDGVVGTFEWKDIDQPDETPKPMQYWMRELA